MYDARPRKTPMCTGTSNQAPDRCYDKKTERVRRRVGVAVIE